MPHRPGHRNLNRAAGTRVVRNRQRITNSTIVDGNDRPVITRTTTGTSVSFNGPGGGVNSRTTAPRNVGMRTVNQPQPNNSVRLFRAEADNMYRKPDGTFVELKNDRGLSQKVKAAVDQLGKAWTNQAVRKTIESNDAMKNISNQIEAGKSEALASKILDNYKVRFPETSFEQAA